MQALPGDRRPVLSFAGQELSALAVHRTLLPLPVPVLPALPVSSNNQGRLRQDYFCGDQARLGPRALEEQDNNRNNSSRGRMAQGEVLVSPKAKEHNSTSVVKERKHKNKDEAPAADRSIAPIAAFNEPSDAK